MHYERISITITPAQHTRLKALALAQDRSVSSVIRQLVDGDSQASDPFNAAAEESAPVSCTRCRNLGYACSAHA